MEDAVNGKGTFQKKNGLATRESWYMSCQSVEWFIPRQPAWFWALPDPNPAVCVCDFDPRSVEDQR
jgi:hypothetical protein